MKKFPLGSLVQVEILSKTIGKKPPLPIYYKVQNITSISNTKKIFLVGNDPLVTQPQLYPQTITLTISNKGKYLSALGNFGKKVILSIAIRIKH